jgi:hypothetical protein
MTKEERNVVMNSLLNILDCEYKPFSFKILSKFFKWNPYDYDKEIGEQEVSFAQ